VCEGLNNSKTSELIEVKSFHNFLNELMKLQTGVAVGNCPGKPKSSRT
jgi:hypothetical protein